MKFRCERDVLAEALGTAQRAAGRTGAQSGVHLKLTRNQLVVTGSDTELTIQVREEVTGEADGVTVLPKVAGEIVRTLGPGRVDLAVSDDEVRIAAGRSEFRVRTLSADDFPRVIEPVVDGVPLTASDFAQALDQVVRAASGDDNRQILTGVLLTAEDDGLRLVATDSYRLALRDIPGTTVLRAGQKVLVPSRALKELQRLLPSASAVELRLGERDVTFDLTMGETSQRRLVSRLIDGEFPNYRQLIPPSYPNRLTVTREVLLDAIKRLKPLAAAKDTPPIRLTMSGDGLRLHVTSQELGQADEELDATYKGTDMTVAFNPDYLAQGVDAVPGEEVVLETLDALKPAVLRPADGTEYTYLLMPVRVP